MDSIVNIFYIFSAILFIYGIRMLGRAETARRGNFISSIGMLLAVVVTLINQQIFEGFNLAWIAGGLIIGGSIGYFAANRVEMTGMPELVALFNGFGGLASLLVGWAEYQRLISIGSVPMVTSIVIFITILIGSVTFTGSIYAWGKLSGRVDGKPVLFPGQREINYGLLGLLLILGIVFVITGETQLGYTLFIVGVVLALAFGVLGVMPIGAG